MTRKEARMSPIPVTRRNSHEVDATGWLCDVCGCMVIDSYLHARWHEDLAPNDEPSRFSRWMNARWTRT
jgi:hypothetical protein